MWKCRNHFSGTPDKTDFFFTQSPRKNLNYQILSKKTTQNVPLNISSENTRFLSKIVLTEPRASLLAPWGAYVFLEVFSNFIFAPFLTHRQREYRSAVPLVWYSTRHGTKDSIYILNSMVIKWSICKEIYCQWSGTHSHIFLKMCGKYQKGCESMNLWCARLVVRALRAQSHKI